MGKTISFLPSLAKKIKNQATTIQFAKDGKYEEAWIIRLSEQIPSEEEIGNYVNKNDYENLIVEYIWNPNVDSDRYVLTVEQDHGCKEKDGKKFISICLDSFYKKLPFNEMLNVIDQKIVGHPFLLKTEPDKVRLGVFNHWFSVGPIDLWNKGEMLDENTIKQKISERPEVKSSELNYLGLAFIYNFSGDLPGPYHSFKTPCCKKVGNHWVADEKLILGNMEAVLTLS